MVRLRCLVVLLFGVASGCKASAPPAKPGSKFDVTITHASYGDHSDTPGEVKKRCKFDKKVAESVVDFAPGSSLSSGKSSKVLSMEVVAMRGVEPTYTGDRSVIVRGRLEDSGVEVATFRIKRSASGGVFSGWSGVCRSLDEIADIMGEDVADWLASDPDGNAELEE